MCECMAKLFAHTRKLKGDNVNLKGLTASNMTCQSGDLHALETVNHLVMQCPGYVNLRNDMNADIRFIMFLWVGQ